MVDLGQGQYLFALLKGYTEFTGRLAFFLPLRQKPLSKEEERRCLRPARSPARFDRAVTKSSLRSWSPSPTSPTLRALSAVDPDDLAAHFGPGYALSSIKLAITDEPVTTGKVEAVLGWWEAYEKQAA